MTTRVEKTIEVDVPVRTAYNQWTQFEDFPQFMGGVDEVRQVTDSRLHWVAQIAGVRREWDATILEQVPDSKVAWAATEGATNAGAVYFTPMGTDRTSVRLVLEYEPEGLVEAAGDKLGIIERQATSDLEKFKSFIESKGHATGAWRGDVDQGVSVGTPGVEAAAASQGDDGKAGVSGTAIAAGAAVAAAAGAGIAAAARSKSGDEGRPVTERPVTEPVETVEPVPATSEASWTTTAAPLDADADLDLTGSAAEPGAATTDESVQLPGDQQRL